MSKKMFQQVVVDKIQIDFAYQRDFDEARARSMAAAFDESRIGVPVLAQRPDSTLWVIDGQHRTAAAKIAGRGSMGVLCEIHTGLSRAQEAELFLKLNGGRKAVRVFDKYKARMVAREPIALEFTRIVESCGLRIGTTHGKYTLCAIQTIESVHTRNKNLAVVLGLVKRWSNSDVRTVDGDLLKDVSNFLVDYADEAEADELLAKLAKVDPAVVARKILGRHDAMRSKRRLAANSVLREIYNTRRPRRDHLSPVIAVTA